MPIVSARWQALLLALLFFAATGMGVEEAFHGENDFDGLQLASVELVETGAFSESKAIRRYPPTFQVLMLPFAWLSVGWGGVLFTLLSLAALRDLPGRLELLTGLSPARQAVAWWAVLPFTLDVLRLAQNGIVLLWFVVVGLLLVRRRAPQLGGMLLGVAALAKLLPALFLAVPWWLGRGLRSLRGAALALALIVAVSLIFTTPTGWADALDNWWTVSRETQTPWAMAATGASSRYNNQGLGIVLARTFGDMGKPAVLADGAVNLAKWDLSVVWWIYGFVFAAIAVITLRAALAARRLSGDLAWAGALAIGCCAMLIASPLIWTHYYLWTLPALCALIRCGRSVTLLAWLNLFALIKPARGLGAHTWIVVALLVLLMLELSRHARASSDELRLPRA